MKTFRLVFWITVLFSKCTAVHIRVRTKRKHEERPETCTSAFVLDFYPRQTFVYKATTCPSIDQYELRVDLSELSTRAYPYNLSAG